MSGSFLWHFGGAKAVNVPPNGLLTSYFSLLTLKELYFFAQPRHRYIQLLPVLSHRPSRDIVAFYIEEVGEFFVGERALFAFFSDIVFQDLFHFPVRNLLPRFG